MRNEEYHMQVQFVNWLRHKYPNLIFTIAPSGMKLPIGVAKKMKAMGYKAGTPDIMIFQPSNDYFGMFVELKTRKGRVTEQQKDLIIKLNQRGYYATVCRSVEEAKQEVHNYFLFRG